jgi:MFS family permease
VEGAPGDLPRLGPGRLRLHVLTFALIDIQKSFTLDSALAGALGTVSTCYAMLFALRALFGIGMGGAWAAGMPLALEHWPARLRGIASGLLQGGFSWGFGVAESALWLARKREGPLRASGDASLPVAMGGSIAAAAALVVGSIWLGPESRGE